MSKVNTNDVIPAKRVKRARAGIQENQSAGSRISTCALRASVNSGMTTSQELIERLDWIKFTPIHILNLSHDNGASLALLQKKYPQAQIIEQLPLGKHTMDLIFANLFLPACENFNDVFAQWINVLKPDGLLMFTTLGLDPDIHDIGDLLLQVGFSDPVMDVEDDVVFGMAWGRKEKVVSVALKDIKRL